ncbi:MAG: N-acetylneuraminate synthase [Cyclobacteriaceae bacterium]
MTTNRVTIIAEAGVNHNGDLDIARRLIDAAAEAGADFVKFQTFKAEKLVSASAKKADYQSRNIADGEETQLGMLKKLELDQEKHTTLIEHAYQQNVKFLSTPFDLESVDLLSELGITVFKVPSGEITNYPLLKKIGAQGKPVIVSTGMANLGEIEQTLDVLLSTGLARDNITVLHCNTEYPTPMEDVNLRAMLTIAQALKVNVGYSDHTLGIEVPIAAVALGATVIEKHFTLDRQMKGPDHRASLEPGELKVMVSAIRNIEKAMGDGIKKPSPSEQKNIAIARKSIHLASAYSAGHILTKEDLAMKRPGDGISPMEQEKLLGLKLLSDLPQDHKLQWSDLGA